jgi:hypothetical protein
MPRPLPLRLRTQIGEPAHGVLLRLAARHHDPDVGQFAADFGLSLKKILAGHGAEHLASIFRIDWPHLARFTPKIDVRSRTVELSGELLLLNDWSVRARRWCPLCLKDDRSIAMSHGQALASAPWHRALWDIRSVGTCPIHNVYLLDSCPSCGTTQDFAGPSIDYCRCGGDLSGILPTRGASKFSSFVAERLGLMPPRPLSPVDGLNLKDAIPFLERLGQCARLGHLLRKPKLTAEERSLALETGIAVAEHWPTMFLKCLDRLLEEARAAGITSGAIESYGWVYQGWIAAPLQSEVANRLRPLLKAHATAHSVIAVRTSTESRTLNATQAARELGMGYTRARRLLASEGLLLQGSRPGLESAIAADRVAVLKAFLTSTLNSKEVAERLGTAKAQTRDILSLGFLIPIEDSSLPRYLTHDVEALLQRLTNGLALRSRCPKQMLPLPQACRAKRIKIATALKAILDGSLIGRGRLSKETGLRQLLVQPSDLSSLRSPTSPMSVDAAAQRLGIHHEAVLNLVRIGVLGKHLGPKRNLIAESDVGRFERQYVPAAEVARCMGKSVHAIILELRARGFDPAFRPPSCRQVIFERRSVLKSFPQFSRAN